MAAIKLNLDKLQKQKWLWFVVYTALSIIFIYIINDIIITDPQYFTGGNDNSVTLFQNVYTVIYFIYPVYLFLRIVIIVIFIKMGLSFFKIKEIKFMTLFTLVLIAEFVFLIPDFMEIIWFLLIHTEYTMEEVNCFLPLNLLSLINKHDISSAYIYPIKLINLFEIMYWLLLIIGIKEITAKTTKESFKIVASSYGLLLFLIITFRYLLFSTILPG